MANQLPHPVAEQLLDKLSTDDDFRSLFSQNPRAALRQIGYETPAADRDWAGRDPVLPLYQLKGGLASKEQLRDSKDRLLKAHRAFDEATVKGGVFGPFDICAN